MRGVGDCVCIRVQLIPFGPEDQNGPHNSNIKSNLWSDTAQGEVFNWVSNQNANCFHCRSSGGMISYLSPLGSFIFQSPHIIIITIIFRITTCCTIFRTNICGLCIIYTRLVSLFLWSIFIHLEQSDNSIMHYVYVWATSYIAGWQAHCSFRPNNLYHRGAQPPSFQVICII